jgi:NAD(P)-dependent dehydrogenase (short-subunit alcohol dehydrogenase family)
MIRDLSGKVAVVTGAGSGIGRGYSLALAEAGMDVVVSDLNLESAEETAGMVRELEQKAIAVQTDVSDREGMKRLADAAYDNFGRVDVLCLNAGIGHYLPFHDTPAEVWDKMIGTNIGGSVNGMLAFWNRMRAQDGDKHVVITSSIAGMVLRTKPPRTAYQTTKYALVGFAESMAAEGEEFNIGFSVVCAGPVTTSLGANSRRILNQPPPDPNQPPMRFQQRVPEHPIEPIELGRTVRRAIERGDFWVLPHPEIRYLYEERSEAIYAAFEQAARDIEEDAKQAKPV